MRGSIRKRSKDSYTVTISLGWDATAGKYRYAHRQVQGTKRDAESVLAEMVRQTETGTLSKPDKTTLSGLLNRWLEDYARPRLQPRTVESYEDIIRKHIIPSLGWIAIKDLRPDHLNHHYAQQLKTGRINGKGGLGAKSVRNQHMVLHAALDAAVKWGLLMRNVADAADPPTAASKEPRIMTVNEAKDFLVALRESRYAPLFCLFLFSGLRRSEALALRWSDLDFEANTVSISRSLHELRNGELVFQSTKTKAGRRLVSVPAQVMGVLAGHKTNVAFARRQFGLPPAKDDDLVFTRLDGRPLLPATVTHAWIKLVRRLGLPGIRLHDARHTYASLMLRIGTSPKVVQELLGHAQIETTLGIYSHVLPGIKEDAVEKLGNLLPIPVNNLSINH